jgi:hypothetical protein
MSETRKFGARPDFNSEARVTIQNIENILVFRLFNGKIITQEKVSEQYPIVPAGSMNYFGVTDDNLRNLDNGTAMSGEMHDFMQDIVDSLTAGAADAKTVVLGVEPSAPEQDPYAYVSRNIRLLRQLATDVKGYQSQAADSGKRLTVVMRYASEMNGNVEVYAGRRFKDTFKQSFVEVRDAVRQVNPAVLFSFSPMINGDIDEAEITDYWPGDENVDIIGGTWYVHGDDPQIRQRSIDNMKAYYKHRSDVGKPLAIDEFGGALGRTVKPASFHSNDKVLPGMLDVIAGLRGDVTFRYGLIFLDQNKYGVDATLDFLRP